MRLLLLPRTTPPGMLRSGEVEKMVSPTIPSEPFESLLSRGRKSTPPGATLSIVVIGDTA